MRCFKEILSLFFLLFLRLHLQVRSLWSPHQGFSVISALFSTGMRELPRNSTVAAENTMKICRYTQTNTLFKRQPHILHIHTSAYVLTFFPRNIFRLKEKPSRPSAQTFEGCLVDFICRFYRY